MNWEKPILLWLLALALPWLFLAWRLAKKKLATTRDFANPITLKTLLASANPGLRFAKRFFLAASLCLIILSLAGPLYGSRTTLLRKRGIDIVFAIDFSKSMLAQDVQPNRSERLKAELFSLLDRLEGHRIGIVAFAGDTMSFPLTNDQSALRLFLRDLHPQDMPIGGTAIDQALSMAQSMLLRIRGTESTQRDQVVVLMTDGEDHEGDPVQTAEEMADKGIRIYSVSIGSEKSTPIPLQDETGRWTGNLLDAEGNTVLTSLTPENETTLKKLAELTHGRYIRSGEGRVGVDQLEAEFARLKQTDAQTRKITTYENRYRWFLVPAWFCLLLSLILPDRWRRLASAP